MRYRRELMLPARDLSGQSRVTYRHYARSQSMDDQPAAPRTPGSVVGVAGGNAGPEPDHRRDQIHQRAVRTLGLESTNPLVLVIMGVSGSGKTTVAEILAGRIGW